MQSATRSARHGQGPAPWLDSAARRRGRHGAKRKRPSALGFHSDCWLARAAARGVAPAAGVVGGRHLLEHLVRVRVRVRVRFRVRFRARARVRVRVRIRVRVRVRVKG